MRQLLSIIFAAIIASASSAQTINWSPEVNVRAKGKMKRLFTTDSASFSAVIAQYKAFADPDAIVQEFNMPGVTAGSSYTVEPNEQNLEGMVVLGNRIYALFINTDTENNLLVAKGRVANDGDADVIEIGSVGYKRAKQKGSFDFVESKNHTKLLVVESPPIEKYNMERFRLTMFNDSLNKLWTKEIKLPYLDQEFNIINSKVDGHGNVFLLTTHKDILSKQNNNRRLSRKNYTVLVYSEDKNKLKEFDIRLKDKWVSGLNMSFNRDGDVMVGGFYNDTKVEGALGSFYLTIDKDSIVIKNKSLSPFGQGFIDQLVPGRQQSKNIGLEDFQFDNFVIGKDGCSYMTAEQYFVRTSSYFDQRTGVTNYTYYYHYNDIVVVKFGLDGKVLWTKKVAKKQVTMNDNGDYSGYVVVPRNDGICLLYNDHLKNFVENDEEAIRTMNNPQRSITAMVTINKNGAINKKPLFDLEEQGTIILPEIGEYINAQKFVIYTKQSRVFRFASIAFDD